MKEDEERSDHPRARGDQPGKGDPSFRVVDRRHGREGADASGDEEGDGDARGAPTYLVNLMRAIEEKDERLGRWEERHREAAREYEASLARVRKDAAKENEKGRREVVLAVLPVVDNFDRALRAATEGGEAGSFLEGMELIRSQLLDALKAMGVTRVAAMGRPFDPAEHDAAAQVPVDDPAKDGKVVGVIAEGYRMGDSLLRAATVAVGRHAPG